MQFEHLLAHAVMSLGITDDSVARPIQAHWTSAWFVLQWCSTSALIVIIFPFGLVDVGDCGAFALCFGFLRC